MQWTWRRKKFLCLHCCTVALLHKKFSKNKRRHKYCVHSLLCLGLETGQSQMAGSYSVSFINNPASNDSRGDCLNVFKNSERDDKYSSFPLRAARDRSARGNGTTVLKAYHSPFCDENEKQIYLHVPSFLRQCVFELFFRITISNSLSLVDKWLIGRRS